MSAARAEACFERLEPLLQEALSPEGVQALRIAVGDARVQVWPGEACLVLTEVTDFALSGVRVLSGRVFGDEAEAAELRPGIEAWAHVVGCDEATFHSGSAADSAE